MDSAGNFIKPMVLANLPRALEIEFDMLTSGNWCIQKRRTVPSIRFLMYENSRSVWHVKTAAESQISCWIAQ